MDMATVHLPPPEVRVTYWGFDLAEVMLAIGLCVWVQGLIVRNASKALTIFPDFAPNESSSKSCFSMLSMMKSVYKCEIETL